MVSETDRGNKMKKILPPMVLAGFLLLASIIGALACSSMSFRLLWSKDPRSGSPLFRIVENGKVGFINRSGTIVIPAKFDEDSSETGDFIEGLACVRVDRKWGFIDEQGRMVIEPQFESPASFSEGLARVYMRSGYGFIDKEGKWVIPPSLSRAGTFSEGLAVFREDYRQDDKDPRLHHIGRAGFIDHEGNEVIKPQFAAAWAFKEGLARVAADGNCWFEGESSNFRIAAPAIPMMDSCGGPGDAITEQCLQGYIDPSGDYEIEPRFKGARDFKEGLAAVNEGQGWGFIEKSGRYLVEPRYSEVSSFSEGLACVKTDDGKWGYIDRDGNFRFMAIFDTATPFNEGASQVSRSGRVWFMDRSGKTLFEVREGWPVSNFVQGLASVRLRHGEFAWLDKAGQIVFQYQAFDALY